MLKPKIIVAATLLSSVTLAGPALADAGDFFAPKVVSSLFKQVDLDRAANRIVSGLTLGNFRDFNHRKRSWHSGRDDDDDDGRDRRGGGGRDDNDDDD